MTDGKERKFIEDAGSDLPTLIGNVSALRDTDSGVCSTCLELSATLINGKCPKHATVVEPVDGSVDLLSEQSTRNCWTPRK